MLLNKYEKLKRENNRLQQRIKNVDTQGDIEKMVEYAWSKGVSMYSVEVFRNDLISMAMDAELRGESLDDAIGGDRRDFCDSVVHASSRRMVETIVYGMYIISAALLLFGALEVFFVMGVASVMDIMLSTVLSTCVFALGVCIYYMTFRFRLNKGVARYLSAIVRFVLVFVYLSFSDEIVASIIVKDSVLFRIRPLLLLAALVAAFIALRLAWSALIGFDSAKKKENGAPTSS